MKIYPETEHLNRPHWRNIHSRFGSIHFRNTGETWRTIYSLQIVVRRSWTKERKGHKTIGATLCKILWYHIFHWISVFSTQFRNTWLFSEILKLSSPYFYKILKSCSSVTGSRRLYESCQNKHRLLYIIQMTIWSCRVETIKVAHHINVKT